MSAASSLRFKIDENCPAEFAGLIVMRPENQQRSRLLSIVRQLLPLLRTERLDGRLWIVDESGIRE